MVAGLVEYRGKKFELGRINATPGAIEVFGFEGLLASLVRHADKDWGDVCEFDAGENDQAIGDAARVFSSYEIGEDAEKLWVITEADRSATTLLLPSEY